MEDKDLLKIFLSYRIDNSKKQLLSVNCRNIWRFQCMYLENFHFAIFT